jgi:hypothetical protein
MNSRHPSRFAPLYVLLLGAALLIAYLILADREQSRRVTREISTARPL